MIKEAIDRVLDLKTPETVEIHGLPYALKSATLVKPPRASALGVATLSALVEYVKTDFDKLPKGFAVHVEGHDTVSLITGLTEKYRDREILLKAELDSGVEVFPFGKFMPHEEFMIAFQARVKDTTQKAELLKLMSRLKCEAGATTEDDGVSQTVTAKKGVSLVETVKLPNPVKLQPYRTFLEVAQPESEFIFRVREDRHGGGVNVGLFEADGGAWRNDARAAIRTYLEKHLPTGTLIIA